MLQSTIPSLALLLLLLHAPPTTGDMLPCELDLAKLLSLANQSRALPTNASHAAAVTAVALFDSWGTTPTLLSFPRSYDYGKYDACRYISVQRAGVLPVATHYCTAQIETSLSKAPIVIGVCLPESCDAAAINTDPNRTTTTTTTTTTSTHSPLVSVFAARDAARGVGGPGGGLIKAIGGAVCGTGAVALPSSGSAVVAILVLFAVFAVIGACLPAEGQCTGRSSSMDQFKKPLLPMADGRDVGSLEEVRRL